MRFPVACLMVIGLSLTDPQHTIAAPVTPNPELQKILAKLATTASTDQYRQINDAVKSSPHLTDQLNALAISGKLTEITILTSAAASNAPKPGPFNAWLTGTSIIFTETLLSELTKNRAYDVVYPDDILPNNTTFVLAHFAYHLDAGKVPMTPVVNDYVEAMLSPEARAFIQAWNDSLDAAVQQNQKPLTPRQISNLMMNMRYRFAYLTSLSRPSDKLHLEQEGAIEQNESNTKAIATTLKHSSVTDIQ